MGIGKSLSMSTINHSDEGDSDSSENEDISGTLEETENAKFKNTVPGLT